jgi:hypothetical protein
LVGGRDGEYAMAFMDDLRSRLANRVQLTSDGHRAYLEAVEGAFGGDVDYAMLVKLYGHSPQSAKGRYSPAECIGARKERIEDERDTGNGGPPRVGGPRDSFPVGCIGPHHRGQVDENRQSVAQDRPARGVNPPGMAPLRAAQLSMPIGTPARAVLDAALA